MSQYIKLEDVNTIIVNYYPISHNGMEILDFTEKINSLPSIDPEAIIDEMMDGWGGLAYDAGTIEVLKEKFKS